MSKTETAYQATYTKAAIQGVLLQAEHLKGYRETMMGLSIGEDGSILATQGHTMLMVTPPSAQDPSHERTWITVCRKRLEAVLKLASAKQLVKIDASKMEASVLDKLSGEVVATLPLGTPLNARHTANLARIFPLGNRRGTANANGSHTAIQARHVMSAGSSFGKISGNAAQPMQIFPPSDPLDPTLITTSFFQDGAASKSQIWMVLMPMRMRV